MGVMNAWVAEFVLRRYRNPRVSPANLLLALKLEDCDVNVNLKKSCVLRDISMCLARGKFDERMLDLLETLELLLLEENTVLLDSYKSGYCWMAVECTLNFMWPVDDCDSLFSDALERIWTQRIGVLKEHKSRLVTSELLKWETDFRNALKEPEIYQRILETNIRYTASTYLNKLIKDQWALFGCSSLESIIQKWFTKSKAERVRRPNAARKVDNLGGSHNVDENIDEQEQEHDQKQDHNQEQEQEQEQEEEQEQVQEQEQEKEQEQKQEQENESSVCKGDKMAAKELKDCLLQVQVLMESSIGIGPSNANDQVLDVTPPPPPPRPGGDQDHNKTPDNVNDRGLDDSQGTSSGRIRPYLPTPVTLKVSPLKKGSWTKPQFRRRRKFWNPEEVDALREGVKEYGRAWKDIKNAYPTAFADRTEVDLKDKWRNMIS